MLKQRVRQEESKYRQLLQQQQTQWVRKDRIQRGRH
jgi:hypothetical protein